MIHHCIACLFEFHCNFISICKNLHIIILFGFFILFITTRISSVYTNDIFPLMFVDEISDKKIQLANITTKYEQKKSIDVSVCIC